ncbi:MAG: EVE domain-containing protein [Cenarchaeum symbiont of Oopsacas minuta]|nr:EVE domain-containing protein [Cenarchaeum symbiont of Oopsacas minuta]
MTGKIKCQHLSSHTMKYWLAKQEPSGLRGYSFEQFAKDKKTVWDGVHNNLALKHMRTMKKGDLVLYYHTGTERQAVGIMKVVSDPYPNPEEKDDRFVVVDVKYERPLTHPVRLDAIKADSRFAGWDLLRISRLSIVPVTARIWSCFSRCQRLIKDLCNVNALGNT